MTGFVNAAREEWQIVDLLKICVLVGGGGFGVEAGKTQDTKMNLPRLVAIAGCPIVQMSGEWPEPPEKTHPTIRVPRSTAGTSPPSPTSFEMKLHNITIDCSVESNASSNSIVCPAQSAKLQWDIVM
jgi:hypothetical protein